VKAFFFRLDRILKLRGDAEQAQAKRYGEAARKEAELERRCREQAEYLTEIGDRLTPAAGQVTTAGELRALQLTSDAAATQLDHSRRARADAEIRAEGERVELAKARIERKTLERLKDQQRADWREADKKQDQKDTDEIAARTRGRE
jgi:flagellar export protein FliJ